MYAGSSDNHAAFVMSSHVASTDVVFASTPIISTNAPQREIVDVSVTVVPDSAEGDSSSSAGGDVIVCYTLSETLGDTATVPSCNVAKG